MIIKKAYQISISGLVQGVGFRPFIFRIARKYDLKGSVENNTKGVSVIVECDENFIQQFKNDILELAPPASRIKSVKIEEIPLNGYSEFSISGSKTLSDDVTEISPDIAVCKDCLIDMEIQKHRINYPFINCTNCGPRFTIIRNLPYDRDKTTMQQFNMCAKCSSEFHDVLDRRFHAQPIACNQCGPAYSCISSGRLISAFNEIVKEVSGKIDGGEIIAIKGLGGYFLMCDALQDDTVHKLRIRKLRDSKPFAVMFKNIEAVREYCFVNLEEEELLESWRKPIVLLKQKKEFFGQVNNGLDTIGAMLPYMPLHYMIFKQIKTPVVILTSGNIADNPIIIEDQEAKKYLKDITDTIVWYNREIYNRADDSVVMVAGKQASIIRRSRGYVPGPIDLNRQVDGILALGAEQKNTFSLGIGKQALLSQYIGDLKNAATFDFYRESITKFSAMFNFNPSLLVCDMHPDYLSTTFASDVSEQLQIPLLKVQHHHAHIASAMAEHHLDEEVIGISLDGTGYGLDGNMWGGEFFITNLCDFKRYAHFDYIAMPGGDKAISEPWRMAMSYIYKYFGKDDLLTSIPWSNNMDIGKKRLIYEMIDKKVNSPLTSSAGRLFDAVAALLGLCNVSTFDAEAPMRLESVIYHDIKDYYPYHIDQTVILKEMFQGIIRDINNIDKSIISVKFHNTIAKIIVDVSEKIRTEYGLKKVVLSGGVFQNRYLIETSIFLLKQSGFDVYINNLVPANDGGISLGQLVIAAKKQKLCV